MYSPSRDQARQFLFETWRKYRGGETLSDIERIALDVIAQHPEYHALLDDPTRNLDRDFTPEDGAINPFLHLSLHLAIEEQLAIDQPQGIRAYFKRIALAAGSEHDARHALLECLAEILWQAQRSGSAPDQALYLACLEKKSGK
jgi:hypothetical protein